MALQDANTVASKPSSPIEGALGRLHERMETLESSVESLVSRLHVVLKPSGPRAAVGTTEALNDLSVPHASILHSLADSVDAQIDRVRDLLERLAL